MSNYVIVIRTPQSHIKAVALAKFPNFPRQFSHLTKSTHFAGAHTAVDDDQNQRQDNDHDDDSPQPRSLVSSINHRLHKATL